MEAGEWRSKAVFCYIKDTEVHPLAAVAAALVESEAEDDEGDEMEAISDEADQPAVPAAEGEVEPTLVYEPGELS